MWPNLCVAVYWSSVPQSSDTSLKCSRATCGRQPPHWTVQIWNIPTLQEVLLGSFALSSKIPRCLLGCFPTSPPSHKALSSNCIISGTFSFSLHSESTFGKRGQCIYSTLTTQHPLGATQRERGAQNPSLNMIPVDRPAFTLLSPLTLSACLVPNCPPAAAEGPGTESHRQTHYRSLFRAWTLARPSFHPGVANGYFRPATWGQ